MAAEAERGKIALAKSDFASAIKHYTAAIKEAPTSPEFFIQRSTAYQRNKQSEEALKDAEQAVLNGQKRAKKEAIVEAQFRRATALYSLGRYGDADFVFKKVKALKPDHKACDMYISKVATEVSKLPEDDERRKCTVTETPTAPTGGASGSNGTSKAAPVAPPPVQQTPADKIRYEWYQNTETVYFTLLAKGVPKEKATVEIGEQSLSISFPLTTGSSYELTLDPLFATVIPDRCITRIMTTKVEICLVKATPNQKWTALESAEPKNVKADSVTGDDPVKKAIFADTKQTGPAYPTSSKSGPKDWDKVAKDLRVNEPGSDGKPSIEDDDDYEGGDESNHFFKKLFKGANPDMQRAMMKSYTESNGTSLSTNWDEVSKGRVETVPPDGMEAKNWSK